MKCRFCDSRVSDLFVSLGSFPLSNSYLTKRQLRKKEPFYPLDVYVCRNCFLVQLGEFESAENIFSNYAYFSSYSDTWLEHAKDYVNKMIRSFGINKASHVVEIASNDGYLLQYFVKKRIPVLGIEPARNVAKASRKKGIPTETIFFGQNAARALDRKGKTADLIIGNNVLAHVPDLNDFVAGLKILLKPKGIITMEFPHLMRLIKEVQFDTIYHEHFSYFSFLVVEKIFAAHALAIFDVEELATHGGSLRIYAGHRENGSRPIAGRVHALRHKEERMGYANINTYTNFSEKVKAIRYKILDFLATAKKDGKTIVGYGAAAKGNTLLNYCGIKTNFIDYVADRNPYKQGRYLPGSRIPIVSPNKIKKTKPDYVFILSWNIKDEIMDQLSFIRRWKAKFIIPIPKFRII